MAPPEMNLPYSHLQQGGRGVRSKSRNQPVLRVTFYDNIMITLATDHVQQFYTHQQIRVNQVVLIKSLNKFFNHFLDEMMSKSQILFLDSDGQFKTAVSYTCTGPEVVLTACESLTVFLAR